MLPSSWQDQTEVRAKTGARVNLESRLWPHVSHVSCTRRRGRPVATLLRRLRMEPRAVTHVALPA